MSHPSSIRFCVALALAVGLQASPAWSQRAPADQQEPNEGIDWTANANIGALNLGSDDVRATGDLSLGIGQDNWGVEAWGQGSYFDFDNDEQFNDTQKLEGAGDGWLRLGGPSEPARFTFRLFVGGANYDSTVQNKTVAGDFADQNSWMGRGSLLLGMDLRPSSTFTAYVGLGGGMQYEWYDVVAPESGGGVMQDDNQELTLLGNGRIDARWMVAPSIISLRLHAFATYFKLTRNRTYLSTTGASDATATTFEQIDVNARGYVDIDAASVLGFRPTLHGGLDYIRVSGEGESESTVLPVFGAGVLKPWE